MFNDTTNEEWRAVVGYESTYAVSNHGRIMRVAEGVNTYSGRILTQTKQRRQGYMVVGLLLQRKLKQFYVHRLVTHAFLGEPNELEVNHIDGDKSNNRLSNLEYVTGSQNIRHSIALGLQKPPRGEKCPASKLNRLQVDEIRRLYATGNYSQSDLCRMFNMSQHAVWAIVNYKTWKD